MKRKLLSSSVLLITAIMLLGMVSVEVYLAAKNDRPLAIVRRYKPDVKVYPKDISAKMGEQLFSGDTLRTDENGYAAVQFMDKSFAKVKPRSQLVVYGEVQDDKSTSTRIAMELGEIYFEVTRQGQKDFEVTTDAAVASVKGTRFGVQSGNNYFWVEEGLVELTVTATGEKVELRENMFGQVEEDGTLNVGQLTSEEITNLRNEYQEYEDNLTPKIMKFRFRDADGQIREIDLRYFENR